jgi:hypothetical protein
VCVCVCEEVSYFVLNMLSKYALTFFAFLVFWSSGPCSGLARIPIYQ